MSQRVEIDLDGDGLFDITKVMDAAYLADGSLTSTSRSFDESGDLMAHVVETTSGNGLVELSVVDFDGDGQMDRREEITRGADGGYVLEIGEFDPGSLLAYAETITVSADGRSERREVDLDGDGEIDQEFLQQLNADQSVTTTYCDLSGTTPEAVIQAKVSANGLNTVASFDLDGDGHTEFTRSSETGFAANGSEVTTLTETGADGGVIYQEVRSVDADGLSATTTYDVNGDGIVDGTQVEQTVIHADGSTTETLRSTCADGALRSEFVSDTSADGRESESTSDYDGNGIADRTVMVSTGSDGERIETVTTYNEAGYEISTFVTTHAADGLSVETVRNGYVETTSYSATETESYTWNLISGDNSNPFSIVSTHDIGADGTDSWRYIRTDAQGTVTDSFEVRLDAASKQMIFEEAAKIYDTVLDRDLDSTEYEALIEFISDGGLDALALTADLMGGYEAADDAGHGGNGETELISGGEFADRYEQLTDAEYVTQLLLNTYGRPPSLDELASKLASLNGALDPWSGAMNSLDRAELAVDLAQSAEHVLVGNGHMLTNNFDVS